MGRVGSHCAFFLRNAKDESGARIVFQDDTGLFWEPDIVFRPRSFEIMTITRAFGRGDRHLDFGCATEEGEAMKSVRTREKAAKSASRRSGSPARPASMVFHFVPFRHSAVRSQGSKRDSLAFSVHNNNSSRYPCYHLKLRLRGVAGTSMSFIEQRFFRASGVFPRARRGFVPCAPTDGGRSFRISA